MTILMDNKVAEHFKKVDPILYKVVEKVGIIPIQRTSGDLFEDLCEAIASQQLSVKAADTIFGRFKELFKNGKIDPKLIVDMPPDTIRGVGFSNAKVTYIKDLARRVVDKELDLANLDKLDDDTVRKELVAVKGIGPWTAEMFLIFTLGRQDIFSYGDLGLRVAFRNLYGFDSYDEVMRLSEKWSPFRSYACRLLWRSLEF